MEAALENARAVLADSAATQSEIDAAAAALEEAIAALEEYVEPVDKTELEKAIKLAKSKKEKNYTKKSWAAMQAALKVAEKTLADENATQDEVDAAAAALTKAIKDLAPTTGKNPETGDSFSVTLLSGLAAMSVIGAAALVLNRKKLF